MTTLWTRARSRERGLTLVELMVVVAIIGLLATVIGVAVFHHLSNARRETASIACHRLRNAVQMHAIEHPADDDCPTPAHLKELGEIDSTVSLDDPWSTPYRVECEPSETVAASAGPNHRFGDDDDIRVPVPRRPAGIASQR